MTASRHLYSDVADYSSAFSLAVVHSQTLISPISLSSMRIMAAGDVASVNGTRASVKEYYGRVLGTTKDLKTSACTASSRPSPHIMSALRAVPEEVKNKFYGCGAPLPLGIKDLRVSVYETLDSQD